MNEKVGWIGTGVMGLSMCSHLIRGGYQVWIYTRTKEKAQLLLDLGAQWCATPQEVASNVDVVFSIVGYPQDVEEIYLGSNGVLQGAKKGLIMVDMTTSEPSLARKIYDVAKKSEVDSLDAPVSGGDIGAKNHTLAIMVGGEKAVYDKIMPFFKLMGENIAYMGPEGAGQHTKMANQITIANNMIGVVESLLYATKAGLNLDEMINIIGTGAAASWSLNNLGRRIVKGNFDPGFYIKHFVKDMGIALAEAKRMNLTLPGLALVHQFYIAAMAMGFENLGTQGLYKVIGKLNNIVN